MAFDFPPGTEGLEFTPVSGLTYVYKTNRWVVKSSFNPMSVLVVSDTPPALPVHGQLWWESDAGNLFIWYNDGNSSQWVQVNVPSDFTLAPSFVAKAGDTMSGDLFITKTNPALSFDQPQTSSAISIFGKRATNLRWNLQLVDGAAESGGNVGSDFNLHSYSDTGAYVATPLTVRRGTAVISLNNGQLKFPATANPSSDANTLDDFREGTWLPTLTFGGANTGLVYSARSGTYTKVGRMVEARGQITLSAKGTSTGSAFVGGFPLANGSGHYASINFGYYNGLAGISGTLMGLVNLSDSGFQPYVGSAAAVGACTDANFTATSNIVFTVIYETVN